MKSAKLLLAAVAGLLFTGAGGAETERRIFVYPLGKGYRAEIVRRVGPVSVFTLYNGAVFLEYSRKDSKYEMRVHQYFLKEGYPPKHSLLHKEKADMPGRHIAEPKLAILDCEQGTAMADYIPTADGANRWANYMLDSLEMNGRFNGCEKWEQIKRKIPQTSLQDR